MKYILALLPLLVVVYTEHCMHKNDCQKANVTHCVTEAELGCSSGVCTCYDKNDLGLKCTSATDCGSVDELDKECNATMRHCLDNECHCEHGIKYHPNGLLGGPGGMGQGGFLFGGIGHFGGHQNGRR